METRELARFRICNYYTDERALRQQRGFRSRVVAAAQTSGDKERHKNNDDDDVVVV